MSQTDMLVKLYDLPQKKETEGYRVVHAMTPDFYKIQQFVRGNFDEHGEHWAGEIAGAFGAHPVSCMIAVSDDGDILGFAGYDCTARGYFGPTGVGKAYRGRGIGGALVLAALRAMKEAGYGYAVIGGVEPHNEPFYARVCNAVPIPGSDVGVYRDMLR